MTRRTTVVIGGGAAGTLAARQLIRSGDDRVVLVAGTDDPGPGVAYGAAEDWHLLNSPAATMGADADDREGFAVWCRGRDAAVADADFMPRSTYGHYLREVFADTVRRAADRLEVLPARATRLLPGAHRCAVELDTGRCLAADAVVLAVGPCASRSPFGTEHPRVVEDPWSGDTPRRPVAGPVLLVGTGLTAVDVALSLSVHSPGSPVTAVSRHGLLPRAHRAESPLRGDGFLAPTPTPSLAALWRAARMRAAASGDWRATVDAMRPHVDALWSGLSPHSRGRFLEHGSRLWEIHRHRMAPAIARRLAELRRDGRLEVRSDRIAAVDTSGARPRVAFASGHTAVFAAVVNCTGPGRLPGAADALTRRLLDDGVARIGPFRLGLDVDPLGRLVDATGGVHPAIHVVGALRRGSAWETTAIPEIRRQATDLTKSFSRSGDLALS